MARSCRLLFALSEIGVDEGAADFFGGLLGGFGVLEVEAVFGFVPVVWVDDEFVESFPGGDAHG